MEVNLASFNSAKAVEIYTQKIHLFPQEKTIFRNYFTKQGAKIIDLGCGTGRTTIPLHLYDFNVIGVDNAPNMIDRARKLNPDIDYRLGDAAKLDFPDASFDYALFSFNGLDCLHPEEKRIQCLQEVHRVLKSSGVFAFSSHNKIWVNLPSRRRLKRIEKHSSPYYLEKTVFGNLVLYYITPREQRKQLMENGFKLLKRFGSFTKSWLYYVARRLEK